MARKLKSDKPLFYATLLLLGASLVMVYSGSAVLAPDGGTAASVYLFRQVLWLMLGSAVLAITMRIDYRVFKHPAVVCTALAVTGEGTLAAWPSVPQIAAKTGTLRHTVGLAGYLEMGNEPPIIFCYFVNHLPGPASIGRGEIASSLDRWSLLGRFQ